MNHGLPAPLSQPSWASCPSADEAAYLHDTLSNDPERVGGVSRHTAAKSHALEVKEDQAATTFFPLDLIKRKLTISRFRNDAKRGTDSSYRVPHPPARSSPPRAPRRSAGPVRGDKHRGPRRSELWSIGLQLVVISPARLRSIFHFATSPLGNRPVTLRPRRTNPAIPQPIPPLPSPRKCPKSRGINTSVASRGHGAAAVLCQVPDDRQATSARSEASVAGNKHKKRPRDQSLLERKRQVFPTSCSPRRRLSRCGNRIVGATRERPEEGRKSLVGGALGAPAILLHGTGRHRSAFDFLQPAAGELSPLGNRARSSEVGDCRAGNSSGRLFACLCRGESLSGAVGGVVGMLFS